MVKKVLCSIGLAAAVISFTQPAAAQNSNGRPNYGGPPKPAIRDYGPFPSVGFKDSSVKPASGKCGNPARACLFYGGDFFYSPYYPDIANGLANATTLFYPGSPYGAAVYSPFTVPAGQTWNVTGLFTNDQANFGVLDQYPTEPYSAAYWSINEGLIAGQSTGTVVASGTSAATSTPTGREAFGLTEYTIQVTGLSVTLTSGTYWMIVVPICTNTSNAYCRGTFFESDVEYINTKPKNAFGPPEPIDASFFDSPDFGVTVEQTNSPVGFCDGYGCDAFSAGVLGTKAN